MPKEVHAYLIHTQEGTSIRKLAREFGCEPSTISRRIRRIENRRDDVLVDIALNRLGRCNETSPNGDESTRNSNPMAKDFDCTLPNEDRIEREALRILR